MMIMMRSVPEITAYNNDNHNRNFDCNNNNEEIAIVIVTIIIRLRTTVKIAAIKLQEPYNILVKCKLVITTACIRLNFLWSRIPSLTW